ncbi:Transposase DDE domain protein [Planctomycetes bacterium CA13]|uniref:Transposase DDE domain protein n=1 Tax=Novipirellula herctigrandis TaxID=2527986 RepID=A0A5C5ZC06_9BACT|nr:Transposase DDE domain protein [Planctomycetes bacterium CA13]
MPYQVAGKFHDCFQHVEDPRVEGRITHSLHSILFIVVCATIADADGPAEIEEFAIQKRDWLERFIDIEDGIPSHDTIGRVLAVIKPIQFQQALVEWTNQLRAGRSNDGSPRLVQIDGKTSRGSYTERDKSDALHIVGAWASEEGLAMGQVAVDSKTNEITVIPELIDLIDIRDSIVTLDALGCQKSIAKKIIEAGGDYIFAVKGNHPTLCAAIEQHFLVCHEQGLVESDVRSKTIKEKSRGRNEERFYGITEIPASVRALTDQWMGAKSIGQAVTSIENGESWSSEVRYFLSSRSAKVNEFAKSVRSHWSIESMHWVLDVVFHEDASRIREGHAIENLSFTRRFVITLLKQDTSKSSLKSKRKAAGWNTDFLEKLLFGA